MTLLPVLFKRFRRCSQAEDQVAKDQEEEVANFIWPSMRGTTRRWNHEGARLEDAFAVIARSVAVVSFSR